MKRTVSIATAYFLAIATFLPTPLQAADAPSCPLTLYTSLPLTTNPDGRVSVPVTVQDKNYSFLVDTGGAVATIGWDQAEELGLEKKRADHTHRRRCVLMRCAGRLEGRSGRSYEAGRHTHFSAV